MQKKGQGQTPADEVMVFQVDEPQGWWVFRLNGVIHFGGLSKDEALRNMKRMEKCQT